MSRIVLFGAGTYYKKFRSIYNGDDEIVCMLDNNRRLWGTTVDGLRVFEPAVIRTLEFDYVLPLCVKAYEMKQQLTELGVPEEKICYLEAYRARKAGHLYKEFKKRNTKSEAEVSKGSVLFVSSFLNYDGGTMAVVYGARVLQNRGYRVVLAAQDGNSQFIEEMTEEGLEICLWQGLPYVTEAMKKWAESFEVVFLNTFLMLTTACQFSETKPVLWWIHECSDRYEMHYEKTRKYYSEFDTISKMQKIKVLGVSSVAKKNFNDYYPEKIKDTLPYGIPDEWDGKYDFDKKSRVVFSVIGNMSMVKAQKLFLEAFAKLDRKYREKAELWFIGSDTGSYGEEVKEMVKDIPNVKMFGLKARDEILRLYQEIDVVVCCSLEETMSITVTEGMMLGKICICTDTAGMADYIDDGVNGFVFASGDVHDLADKITQVMHLDEKQKSIRQKARETYENYFTMDVFGDRLEKWILNVKGNKR